MKSPMNCASISAGQPFLNVLAGWIIERFGHDAALLTRILVLLPTRRACRELREAFLEATGGKPILLPRIQPIGDLDEETLFSHYGDFQAVSPAISPLRRELLLARLVMKENAMDKPSAEQATELARQLARLIDDAAREGLDFNGLDALVPEELAAHWQETLDFLKLISHHWPKILQAEEVIDPARHRNAQLEAIAAAWEAQAPQYPVIAAGSTGTIRATARLLKTIAQLPQGMVVLPGLDGAMPQAEWETIGETHPQYALKQLLDAMECPRGQVATLPSPQPALPERIACLRAMLQPPEATSRWMQVPLPLEKGLHGIRMLTADTLLDEARMIAIALRGVLETRGKTAALVTPDRQLARMVAAQMQRFGVEIDDSAGQPLLDTPPGCFLRLVAEMVASSAAPAPLLALLRHPLAAAGMDTAQCRALSRQMELALLRGVRHAAGLEPLCRAVVAGTPLHGLLMGLEEHARPLAACFAQGTVPLREMLEAHMRFAEWLAGTDDTPGGERLWAGEAGNALAAFLADLLQHADLLPQIDARSYPGLFDTLLGEQVYRPRFGLHPRLHILSPVEARLQSFDLVILGALNEGTWPQPAQADPWMSRPMRHAFGLPPTERAIGQSAHDITMLCAAPEVILSRARKVEGTPTVPSRWLVRLATLVNGLDESAYAAMQADGYFRQGAAMLDAPLALPPLPRPQPVPPLKARPRRMSVTAVDTWISDPYMVYAQHILKLRKLPPLDEEPDAADFGSLVHKALELFTVAYPKALPDDAYRALLACGREAFADAFAYPAAVCLWWPRFESMALWIIERERERRVSVEEVFAELKGRWEFTLDGSAFTLTTRIDRLERGREGQLTVIDYKTGTSPGKTDIDTGRANQLPLEALIAEYGVIEPAIGAFTSCAGLEYWKLSGNPDTCKIIATGVASVPGAMERLEALITHYNDPRTPYAAQIGVPARYNDYAHLTRRSEWEEV